MSVCASPRNWNGMRFWSFSAGCQFPAQMKSVNSFVQRKLKWKQFPQSSASFSTLPFKCNPMRATWDWLHSSALRWEPDSTEPRWEPEPAQELSSFGPFCRPVNICKCNHCGQELSTVDNLSMHKIRKHKICKTASFSPLAIQLDLNQTQHLLSFGSEYGHMTVIGEEGTTLLTLTKIFRTKSLHCFDSSILWYYQASQYWENNQLNIQCIW